MYIYIYIHIQIYMYKDIDIAWQVLPASGWRTHGQL